MHLTVDGRQVFAATGGKPFDKTKPAILFLHGNACDHSNWSLQTRWFAYHGYSVLALDFPGNGRSEGPMLPSIEAHADWLGRFLDAAGISKAAAFVGHSMGALIALEAASRLKDRVAKISLLGFAFPMKVNPELQGLADAGDFKAVALMNDWMLARRSHIGGNRNPGTWLLGANIALNDAAPRSSLATGFRACNDYGNGEAAAAALEIPVQILSGERDMMTPPRAAQKIAALLKQGRLDILPQCGHMMMGEKPDETLDALRAFLKS